MGEPRLTRRLLAALVLAGLGLGCGGGTEERAVSVLDRAVGIRCAPDRIDIGERGWRWALGEGFLGDERSESRTFAWTERTASLLLVIGEDTIERLSLTARSEAEDQRLSLSLDGRDLGSRRIPRRWSTVSWEIPDGDLPPGLHRLTLRAREVARTPRDPRPLAVAVDHVRLEGVEACPAVPAPTTTVPPGGFLVARTFLPPEAESVVAATQLEGLRLSALAGDDRTGPLELVGGERPKTSTPVPLDVCCGSPAAVALANAGREAMRIEGWKVRGDRGALAWRLACGLLPWELVGLACLVVLGLVLLRWRRRRPPLRTVGSHASSRSVSSLPWTDVVLVTGLAFALRALFLHLYPEIGQAGDTYEYVLRARRLASGAVPFLSSTAWHAWQTWIRPPGFYLLLAGVLGPLGGSLTTVIWMNAAFSSLVAGATHVTAFALFGRGPALAAGLFAALYLESIVTVSRVLSEPLYMVLLVPALACLAASSRRPSWPLAAAAGLLFGAAAIVRSAPVVFVPLAALLLLAVHGRRRGWRSAVALAAGTIVVVLPWVVRNSLVRSAPTGVDDLAIVNLLQVQPDERFVPHRDLDLETPAGRRAYYERLKRANEGGRLARRGGAVLARNLRSKLLHPFETLETVGGNLAVLFRPYDEIFFLSIHDEPDRCRVMLLTDVMNVEYFLLLALGAWGVTTRARDPATWPLLLWLVLNVAVIALFFHAETKYRLPTLPVAMVFAGAAIAGRGRRERSRGDS